MDNIVSKLFGHKVPNQIIRNRTKTNQDKYVPNEKVRIIYR
jgi:hypothetical protein